MLTVFSDWLFDTSGLTPHGFCLVWDPALIWTYALSDSLIALAYFSIPVALVVVARRRRDLVYSPVLWLFAAFIVLCGTTHWLDVALLWNPVYGLQALVKAMTAAVSVVTAVALWFLMPRLLVLPSPTQMHLANEALLASREQLAQAQKMEAVGQLTGGVAHDFNNLLQVMTGSLSLLEKRIEQGRLGETGRYLDAIRKATDTAARLTSRLLAFSRRQVLQPQPVDIDELAAGMEEMLRRTLGAGIDLRFRPGNGKWDTFCDPAEMESALLNLVINARDAMRGEGTLTIGTADRTFAAAELGEGEGTPGRYVEICVTDTGTGMSAEVLKRAVEPFFTTKPAGQGTGLGLSQVYGFVKQSGGFVRLESAPGRGTSVSLFMPAQKKADLAVSADLVTPPVEAAAAPAGSRTVLVVEDEEDIRAQVLEALGDLNCIVLEASNGQAGLTLLQSAQPVDILITDVGLPGLNGRQLAEAGRALRPTLPVLLVTGYAGEALDEGDDLGGMAVLRKPFGLEELRERVRTLLTTA